MGMVHGSDDKPIRWDRGQIIFTICMALGVLACVIAVGCAFLSIHDRKLKDSLALEPNQRRSKVTVFLFSDGPAYPASQMVKWHDDENNVTCYAMDHGLDCLPDAYLRH